LVVGSKVATCFLSQINTDLHRKYPCRSEPIRGWLKILITGGVFCSGSTRIGMQIYLIKLLDSCHFRPDTIQCNLDELSHLIAEP